MKKITSIMLGLLIVTGVLSGCSSSGNKTTSPNPPPQSAPVSSGNSAKTPAKVLIVYYSLSGTTEKAAQAIQAKTGGDIYPLQPEPPYSKTLDTVGKEVTAEKERKTMRGLKGALPNLSNYDYILLGSPVWSGEPSHPVQKYLTLVDFSGKKVAGFWSAASDPANYADKLKALVQNGAVLEGLSLRSADCSDKANLNAKIDPWLTALGISRPN